MMLLKQRLYLQNIVIGATAFALVLSALPTSAALVPCGTSENPTACTLCDLGVLVINLTNFLMKTVAVPAVGLLVVIGGIMLLISGPSEERLKLGKTIITRAVVGAIIVLFAWVIVATTIKLLTGGTSLLRNKPLPWNQLPACNI